MTQITPDDLIITCDYCNKAVASTALFHHVFGKNEDFCNSCFHSYISDTDSFVTHELKYDVSKKYITINRTSGKHDIINITPNQSPAFPEKIKQFISSDQIISLDIKSIISINDHLLPDDFEFYDCCDTISEKYFGSILNWVLFFKEKEIFFMVNTNTNSELYGRIASGVFDEYGFVGLNLLYKDADEFLDDYKLWKTTKKLMSFPEWSRRTHGYRMLYIVI